MDADKDHLITDDADASYRKCPGVNNVAYVVSNTCKNIQKGLKSGFTIGSVAF